MTPCTIDGKRTLRFVKVEQKSLSRAAELIHHLTFYDDDLDGVAESIRAVVIRLDDDGVYRPTKTP